MIKLRKRWNVKKDCSDLEEQLCKELNISKIIARLLVNRNIKDPESARAFLYASTESLQDPFLMLDMDKAVERICQAVKSGEKITIYGDYDVDGITASSLLYRGLVQFTNQVDFYIPERQSEGYGLHNAALDYLYTTGTKLLITVDCGISAVDEVSYMHGKLPIIITDHHEPPEELPKAYAILNPKRTGCSYPEKNLAGVGVAFKLLQGLWSQLGGSLDDLVGYLEFVAVGTIADIVPLVGENRILVKEGLKRLTKTQCIGFNALLAVCGLKGQKIDTGKVGFVIAPRLNAAGRLKNAEDAVRLLITEDENEANMIAGVLNSDNEERQRLCSEIQAQAEAKLANTNVWQEKVIILSDERWHSGVIGIVASRLVEKFYRPVIMISVKDGIGKGSCRSIPGFNLYKALNKCQEYLEQFGGHKMAAGLTIKTENIDGFRDQLNQIAAQSLTEDDYQPILNIDALLPLKEINETLLEQVACLEPYGMENQAPIFACKKLSIANFRTLGQDHKHLKMRVKSFEATSEVLAWNYGEYLDKLSVDMLIDLVFVPQIHEYQAVRSIQLRALDFIPADVNDLDLICQNQRPDQFSIQTTGISFASIVRQGVIRETISDLKIPLEINFANIHDQRNCKAKEHYLSRYIVEREKILVYVNNRNKAYCLASLLREQIPEAANQVAFYYKSMDQKAKTKISEWLTSGDLTCIISTEPIKTEFKHVLLYHLPYTPNLLQSICETSMNQLQIHMLYNEADVQRCLAVINGLAPDREIIKLVYLTLRTIQGSDIYWTDQQIAVRIGAKYKKTVKDYTIAAAIDILEELGLLRQKWILEQRVIYMEAVPKNKLSLEQSNLFVKSQRDKKIITDYTRAMLLLPCNKLFQGGSQNGFKR